MTIQLIRKDGRVKGFAFFLGNARVLALTEAESELWRICESCSVNEAVVFCRTHAKYVCSGCLATAASLHGGCDFISVSVARELTRRAEKYQEVEE